MQFALQAVAVAVLQQVVAAVVVQVVILLAGLM
jgi:hypothetical protein